MKHKQICESCGDEVKGNRTMCPACTREASRIRKHGELEQLLGHGFRARRLPPGYSDNPGYFGDD